MVDKVDFTQDPKDDSGMPEMVEVQWYKEVKHFREYQASIHCIDSPEGYNDYSCHGESYRSKDEIRELLESALELGFWDKICEELCAEEDELNPLVNVSEVLETSTKRWYLAFRIEDVGIFSHQIKAMIDE